MAIRVEYRFESDDMSDEEYDNQEEQEYIISTQELLEYVASMIEEKTGKEICPANFYYDLITESKNKE